MEARQILEGFGGVRTSLDDTVEPYLYETGTLLGFLNSGYVEVCARTRCLQDDKGAACTIPLTAGRATYPIAREVLVVRAVHMDGQRDPLLLTTTGMLDNLEPGWSHMPRDGRTKFAMFDAAQKTLTLYPAPTEAGTLRLRVWRIPNENEQIQSLDDYPVIELPDPMAIKNWVLSECYMQKDSEMYDPERAAMHLALFEAQFGVRPSLLAMNLWSTSPACRRTRIQDY